MELQDKKIFPMEDISTYLPSEVIYDDGTKAVIEPHYHELKRFLLYVPPDKIHEVKEYTERYGFKGDNIKKANYFNIWDHVIEFRDDGFVNSVYKLGIMDGYLDLPCIYETFDFYRDVYPHLHIYDSATNKWIKEVKSHYLVVIKAPYGFVYIPFQVKASDVTPAMIMYFLGKLEVPTIGG